MQKSRFTALVGRTHRSGTKRRQKRAGRLSNLRAPRPARSPNPQTLIMNEGPAGGQVRISFVYFQYIILFFPKLRASQLLVAIDNSS